ncbi:MAG: FkbM family methyltransferase [Parvibaculum sp.]|uniref:FkbM family methyltransferase n=1 Tax=Parvibaculum sp. TaxID=2024848 RepID=UPI0025F53DA3|nr:FkbM family methyltransferase [Parvibaculum sp.]MCE9650914.1 FkbM family methyltransferase [Parvibaculum sp.]
MNDFVFTGRGIFGNRRHAPYDVLAYLEPGLMLDIGASNGNYSKHMLNKSPQSRVMAFEPFPGNLPILRQNLADEPRVRIVEKAVSDDKGEMPFFTSSKVTSGGGKWEEGYSSLGYIVRGGVYDQTRTIMVQTISVDEAIDNQRVRFMKVDVQGGEIAVLRSASRAFSEQRIDIIHLEFSGERDVFDFVRSHGFVIFDSQYILLPLREPADLSNWDIVEPVKLSTGQIAHRAWPSAMPTIPDRFLDFLQTERKKIGNAFTDLVCVSSSALPQFLNAAMRASRGT